MPDRDDRLTTEDLSSRPQHESRVQHEEDARQPVGTDADPDRDMGDRRDAMAGDGDRASQRDEPLMPPSDLEEYQRRWERVQTGFVDEPRQAVQDADALVAEAMRQLADTFASERKDLEEQWDRAGEVDTEALRVTLQRYRSFFNRLVST